MAILGPLAGGAVLSATFLDFSLWPLAWIAFVPILVGIDRAPTLRSALAGGFVAGLIANVPAYLWLVETIHRFGGFPLSVSALFYAALSCYSALQFVAFSALFRRVGFGPLSIFPAVVWVPIEFLFPMLFPWRVACSQLEVPALLQIGEWTGPYGLSFAMVWVSASLASLARRRDGSSVASVAAALALALGLWGLGEARLRAIDVEMAVAPSVRVGIVQGNLSIERKGNVEYLESNLATYRKLSLELAPDADVLVWPESVINEPLPRDLERLPPAWREILGLRVPLFAGALTVRRSDARYFNSVVLFDADGRVLGLSDKQILMPFGETMPFGSVLPILRRLSPQTGDFEAGTAVVPLDVPGVGRFAPLNCYEDLVASIARRAVARDGAEILFAVANDGWFGETMAPFQHEALALWRAIENRRFLIRVTNTGVTDVIDATGRVVRRLPIFEEAAAIVDARRLSIPTFYQRFGPVFSWVAVAVTLLISARTRRARSERANLPRPRETSPASPG